MRLINRLRAIKRRKNFSRRLCPGGSKPGKGARDRSHAETQVWSCGELNQVSDFLQDIVRPRRLFRRVNHKQLPAVDAMKPDVFGIGPSLIGARL